MDWSQILTFTIMAVVIEVAPGPNFVLICKTVTNAGRASAVANIVGFALAFTLHGALSIFGFSVILLEAPSVFMSVKLAGAAYLLYLGTKAILNSNRSLANAKALQPLASAAPTVDIELIPCSTTINEPSTSSLFAGFRDGFATNLLNPKISLFYLAVFPQFLASDSTSIALSFLLVTIHVAVNAMWFLLVALVLHRLVQSSSDKRVVHLLTLASGVALVGFALSFAVTAMRATA